MKKEHANNKKITDPKDRLLASRAREIRALREDIAGWQESVRLASAFTALLALALTGDAAACGGVYVSEEDGTYAVAVDKGALCGALSAWQVESSGEGEQYRIVFRREVKES